MSSQARRNAPKPARVLFDYFAADEAELTLKEGEIVIVTDMVCALFPRIFNAAYDSLLIALYKLFGRLD
jgi:hypothetical protein